MNLWDRLLNLRMLEGDGGAGGGSGDGDNNPPAGGNSDDGAKFTQEQVNGIIASEKRKNNAALLKDLGFENIEDAKSAIAEYNAAKDKQKDDTTKAQEKADQLQKEKDAESAKAIKLENKLTAINKGCDPKNADDVVTLAMAKVTDDVDFEAALEEVKKLYPAMFESSNNGSTGHGGNPPRGRMTSGDTEGIGKRLAEQRKKDNSTKKNSYFND